MHITHSKTLSFVLKPLILFIKWLGRTNPELLVKIRYFVRFHRCVNLDNPQTLNEKILYLSLRTDTAEWSRLTDKKKVSDYVREKGLEHILIKNYGYWQNVEDVDFEKLPDSFVMKTTHGSGDVMIVKDKSKITKECIVAYFSPFLQKRYGELEGGKHYMRIEPGLIAEELMINDEDSQKYSSSIIDYKIWCFNGKPYYIWVCCNRNKQGTDVMTYDVEWRAHPEFSVFNSEYRRGNIIPQPLNLEEMLNVATILSSGFPCVRVDLYNLGGKIYFGEMTFTSFGGLMNFYTTEFLIHTGSLIDLPQK